MGMDQDATRPRYREMEQFIRGKIAAGDWPPGYQLPTERELSIMFGVSRITTSRALLELQKAGLVVREQGRGTFISPLAKSRIHSGEDKAGTVSRNDFRGLKVVALVLPDTAVDSGFKMIEGAEKWLRQRKYRLLSSVSEFNLEREADLIRGLLQDGVTNLILYPVDSEATTKVVEEVCAKGMKVVVIDRRLNKLAMPFVGSDNYNAGYQITKHLIEVGHRLIAFASGDVGLISSVADRFRGYCQALAESRLPVDPGLVVNAGQLGWSSARPQEGYAEEHRKQTEEVAERTLDYLLGLRSDSPSAVVAANDRTALMLLRTALRRGIKVPDQMAVVGFDDLAGSAAAEVPLTTVRQQFRSMGREAAKLILEEAYDPEGNPREELLPTELIVRRSCGAKALAEA
ncbi:MAG: GntR family transcriptional regulator [Bacteroidota bacterium]